MGGYGSGRQGGRPIADSALFIDLAWMIRTGRTVPGALVSGSLSWTSRGEPSGNIGFSCDMRDPDNAAMKLQFTVTRRFTDEKCSYVQDVPLSYTVPNYGGRRWWMHCPFNGARVAKLYCPSGAEKFASRKAYRLGYHSQRIASRDRAFESLFRLQKQLGCEQGYGQFMRRPKGMWHRTYEKHLQRYWDLEAQCSVEMLAMTQKLRCDVERVKAVKWKA